MLNISTMRETKNRHCRFLEIDIVLIIVWFRNLNVCWHAATD